MKYILTFTCMLVVSLGIFEKTNSSLLINNIEEESNLNKFLVNLLNKYKHFLIVFHVDCKTIDSVNNIVHSLSKNGTLVSFEVYNHDVLQIGAEFVRPEVQSVLHLQLLRNITYWYWLNSHMKINYKDVVVFVAENLNVRSQILGENLKIIKLAGKILLVESTENSTIHIYETCFYCGNKSKTFFLLQDNTPHPLLNNFRNLNNHLLYLVFHANFPYLYCKKREKELWWNEQMDACTRLSGFEGHMLRLVGRKMNFQYRSFVMDSNDTFWNMLKFVNSTKADIAFGAISLTMQRSSLIQFTDQFTIEPYTLVYKYSITFVEIFEMFLEPFTPVLVWILFLVSMALLSTILYLILKVHKHETVNPTTLSESFWIFCHMPLEQSVQNIKSVYRGLPACGLVLALWWWCCLMFCTMYKSMVLSSMVHPAIREPSDLNQLLTAGYKIVGNRQTSDIINDLLNGIDPIYKEAREKVEYGKTACDAFSLVLKERAAMLEEQTMIQYGLRRACPRPESTISGQLRITQNPERYTYHAWALQQGAPYRRAVDHYLGLILSGGLFVKWKRDTTTLGDEKPIPLSGQKLHQRPISVPLRALQPLFLVYSVGIILSTLCLITEILYYAYRFYQHTRIKIIQKTQI